MSFMIKFSFIGTKFRNLSRNLRNSFSAGQNCLQKLFLYVMAENTQPLTARQTQLHIEVYTECVMVEHTQPLTAHRTQLHIWQNPWSCLITWQGDLWPGSDFSCQASKTDLWSSFGKFDKLTNSVEYSVERNDVKITLVYSLAGESVHYFCGD